MRKYLVEWLWQGFSWSYELCPKVKQKNLTDYRVHLIEDYKISQINLYMNMNSFQEI